MASPFVQDRPTWRWWLPEREYSGTPRLYLLGKDYADEDGDNEQIILQRCPQMSEFNFCRSPTSAATKVLYIVAQWNNLSQEDHALDVVYMILANSRAEAVQIATRDLKKEGEGEPDVVGRICSVACSPNAPSEILLGPSYQIAHLDRRWVNAAEA
ncbi:MAG TPA: hypothetical protein VEJ63_18170 [Planctomycetota bacterium]|nr:hypothetical protein [Planctomycetota bacterium]